MINLLPPTIKNDLRYAHRNQALRGWVVALAIALVGVGALATYGLLNLQQAVGERQRQVVTVQAELKRQKLEETQKQIKDISGSLHLSAQVLSKEVLFSKLITQIGAAMPQGAVLAGLNINSTSGGLDLTANALDYVTASQVQVNMANSSNKIFAKADILSIACKAKADSKYPCIVTLRALFNSNNQFLFINQGTAP